MKIQKLAQNSMPLANNFWASGNNPAKLVHMKCREAEIKISVQIFWGRTLNIW